LSRPRIEERALRPATRSEIPNSNDPADNPPATVGPPTARPGDPNGFEVTVEDGPPPRGPTRFTASPWSGWPAEWNLPLLGQFENLVDTAWMCLDLNASIISTMPPYAIQPSGLVPSPTWLDNPDPDMYTSWNEFAKQLWWDYQMGEAFVICTARFADRWPARFHVVEPWLVNVEIGSDGRRHYNIGSIDPGPDLLHIRYKSTTSSARGVGPLDAGQSRMIAAALLQRYASRVVESGGVPYYVITHPDELTAAQVTDLQAQWWESRMNSLGMPAIMSGGIGIETLQISPADMALLDLSKYNESRIAVLLGVPPFLAGLPSGGDSMTYSNTAALFDYHWRAGLKPKVDPVVNALSAWALPRGTNIEVNRDEYVRPGPLERAQTYQILEGIGVLTATDIQHLERFVISGEQATPTPAGVLT
jgi:HK97 family phage portal protein